MRALFAAVAAVAPLLTACSGAPLDDIDEMLVLPGLGTGRFGDPLPLFQRRLEQMPPDPPVITSGDFDGDGNDDLAWSDPGRARIEILMSRGNGEFAFGESPPGTHPDLVVLRSHDFDGDGLDDLAASSEAGVTVLRSDGQRFSFSDREGFNGARSVDFGDISGDRISDMIVAHKGSRGTRITVLEGRGDGGFHEPATYDVDGIFEARAANLDGNAFGDLVLPRDPNGYAVMPNDGTGRLDPPLYFGESMGATCFHVADIDGDFDDDIIGSPNASVVENLGGLLFADREGYDDTVIKPCGPLADLDGDELPDFVRLDRKELRTLLADGEGGFRSAIVQSIDVTKHFEVEVMAAGDFDGDGHHDLVLWVRAGEGRSDDTGGS